MLGEFTVANNVRVVLTSAITNSATSITFNAATGEYQNLPNPSGDTASNGIGIATLVDVYANPTVTEIITYTSLTNNGNGTYTIGGVTRGVEGTTGLAWSAGATMIQAHTAAQNKHANVTFNKATNTLSLPNMSLTGTLGVTGVATLTAAPVLTALTGYVKGNGASATTASSTVPTSDLSGVLAAAQHPALTGDVTNTAGSLATTISAAAVSLSKMANLAANSIIGNNTGSATTPVALTVSQTKTLLGFITASDLNGGTLPASVTTVAASGQVLSTVAAGGVAATFLSKSSAPYYGWQNTSAAADTGVWDIGAGASSLTFRAVNDANSAASTWLTVTRSGTTVQDVSLPTTGIRALGGITASTGVGAELLYDGTNARLNGYNRATSAYTPLIISSSSTQLVPTSGDALTVNPSGLSFGSYFLKPPRRTYSVAATAGTWYRVGSLPADNLAQSAIIYIANIGFSGAGGNCHQYLKLEIGKGTNNDTGTTFYFQKLGQYNSTNYISSIRVVDDGVNNASHVDVQFSTTGTYGGLYVNVVNQNGNSTSFFDDGAFASQGTTAAGKVIDATLLTVQGNTNDGVAATLARDGTAKFSSGITTTGAAGVYNFNDRTTSTTNWAWYADGGSSSKARLYNNVNNSDVVTCDMKGNLQAKSFQPSAGVYNAGTATGGATTTIDWNNGQVQYIALPSSGDVTLAYSNYTAGTEYRLFVNSPNGRTGNLYIPTDTRSAGLWNATPNYLWLLRTTRVGNYWTFENINGPQLSTLSPAFTAP